MKHSSISSLKTSFKKLQVPSLLMGVAVGAVASAFLTCSLFGADVKREYTEHHQDMAQMTHQESDTATNPFMMRKVVSEKDFVKDMKLHHDAAVLMSQQLLTLKDVRPEVRELAQGIISAQMKEIEILNGWIRDLKY